MLAEPMLSIVVAVFNGEPFLPKFFNCLEQQKLENWELILVNDGSTDNSALLLEECIERFPNTRGCRHKMKIPRIVYLTPKLWSKFIQNHTGMISDLIKLKV